VFMTSDATGEIYVLQRAELTATGGGTGGSSSSSTSGGGTMVTSTTASSSTPNAAAGHIVPATTQGWLWIVFTLALSVIGGALFIVV
jgi:hypothetical protein